MFPKLQTIKGPGITFAVDDVTAVVDRLPECRTHMALRRMFDGDIESCCDYYGTVIEDICYQPLLAAVYMAFSQHRPLVLTPDAVWITITQGVAHHMTIHGELLRSRFVSHQGRLDLNFECDWVEGSPENPWPDAFDSWAGQIRAHVGAGIHDLLIADFSTTGPVERTVSQIVMADIFERYFHYVMYCICGIPTITLEGTPADWTLLADKVRGLRVFDLGWWLDHLDPICDQFVRAGQGDVDLKHWQGICKLREDYGGDVINGWVAKLFPYLREFSDGPCTRRNSIFESGQGFKTSCAPPGLSRVPFTCRNLLTGRERPMEMIGGVVGVSQDPETMALRPKVGWAVRDAEKMDVLLSRLTAEHTTFPGVRTEKRESVPPPNTIQEMLREEVQITSVNPDILESMPPDLAKFYNHTDGAHLFGREGEAAFRIVPLCDLERLEDYWYLIAWLVDGSFLAINPEAELERRVSRNLNPGESKCLAAICLCNMNTPGRRGRNPIIAISFTELLERLLDSNGRPYWLDPHFVSYGDAKLFERG